MNTNNHSSIEGGNAAVRSEKGFWFTLFGLFLICFLSYGCCVTVIGFVIEAIRLDLDESVDNVSLIPAVLMAVPCLATPLMKYLMDRFGPRLVTMGGALVSAAGFAVVAASASLVPMLMGFFIAGVGIAMCSMYTAIIIISWWTERRLAFAIGTLYASAAAGSCISPVIINALVSQYGWRSDAYVTIAMFVLLVCPLAFFFARKPAHAKHLGTDNAEEQRQIKAAAQGPKGAYFYAVCAIEYLFCISLVGVFVYAPPFLAGQGFSIDHIDLIFGAANLVSIAGSVLLGRLADRWGTAKIMLLGLIANMVALLLAQDAGMGNVGLLCLGVFVVVWGLTMNVGIQLAPSLLFERYAPERANALYVRARPFAGIAMAAGPIIGGQAFALNNSYSTTFYAMALMIVISLVPAVALTYAKRKPLLGFSVG